MKSILLIEGNDVNDEALNISLMNAKYLIVGRIADMGIVLFIEATSVDDYRNAVIEFAKVPNVTAIIPLIIRNS